MVDAAQAALVQVIFTNRQFKDKSGMPKDLLQSCLRPVLKNLTHIQKLSLPLLQGLSRLLYLLSNWFNVTLGDKLFGYLRQWTEPQKLQSLPDPKVCFAGFPHTVINPNLVLPLAIVSILALDWLLHDVFVLSIAAV